MLNEIKSQIKRLDCDMKELYPDFVDPADSKESDHETNARCLMLEITRMRKLLEAIAKRDEQILFLFFYFHIEHRDGFLTEGTKHAVSKTIEKIIASDDKLKTFIDMYEAPTKGGELVRWPLPKKEDQERFNDVEDQRLEI